MGRRGSIVGGLVAVIGCAVPEEGSGSAQTVTDTGSSTGTAVSGEEGPEVSTTAEPSSTSEAPTSDTEATPQCGNGDLEPGEMCDDGNAIDADGCNLDCRRSGVVLFEHVFDPAPLSHEEVRDIDEAEDGTYVIGGWVAGAGRDAWVARLTEDDDLMWESVLVARTYDDAIFGVAAGDGGKTFAAGVIDELSGTADPWLAALAPTGTIVAAEPLTGVVYGRWYDVEDVGDGIIVVGQKDDPLGMRGPVRNYGYDLVLQAEVDPVAAGPGVALNDACATEGQLFVSGVRTDPTGLSEGLAVLLEGPATQWVGVSDATAGQHSYSTGCAVAGDGATRSFWIAGYDTATTPRWLAYLRARDLAGAVVLAAPTYVGDADMGAFYTEVDTDTAGNVIAVGGTVTGAGEFDWAPVVRKFDPGGVLLWSRTMMPGGFPLGSIHGVTTTFTGELRIAGYATDATGLRHRWIARMTP